MAELFSLQQIVNGLQLGSIYALIALGYTMVYGIVRLINFAHGDFYMIGAYAAYAAFFLFNTYIAPGNVLVFIVLIVAMVVGAAVAMLSDRLAYKPLRYKPKLSSLVTAIGVSMFIEYFFSALPIIGPSPRGFPEVLPKVMWTMGSAQVSNYVVIDLVVAAVLMIGLTPLWAGPCAPCPRTWARPNSWGSTWKGSSPSPSSLAALSRARRAFLLA